MPGHDLMLGPDGDYVDDDAGGFELTQTAAPAVRHQVMDRRGEWVGDVEAGRDVRDLLGRNSTLADLDLEVESLRRSLEPLEQDAIIAEVEILGERVSPNRYVLGTRARDTQSGGVLELPSIGDFGV